MDGTPVLPRTLNEHDILAAVMRGVAQAWAERLVHLTNKQITEAIRDGVALAMREMNQQRSI